MTSFSTGDSASYSFYIAYLLKYKNGGLQTWHLKMFSFPVMKSSFCFSNINIIAVPAASFVNDLRSF